mmetsp:Transcript_77270/g.136244  ORF Transcript_77270/g.136244 Transcript_77270/m.136244 type:complete len:99 (+) Transcript_77270:446-742(+)
MLRGMGETDPLWIQGWYHNVSSLHQDLQTHEDNSQPQHDHRVGRPKRQARGGWSGTVMIGMPMWATMKGRAQGLAPYVNQASASWPSSPYLGGPSFEN